jgi:hypothetical protein
MPVFNVTPRPAQPQHYRSGRTFAARDPRGGPDWGFTGKEGALLLPHVSAPALHDLLDAVEAEALDSDPSLSSFVPPRAPSPWLRDDYGWYPKPRRRPTSMGRGHPLPPRAKRNPGGAVAAEKSSAISRCRRFPQCSCENRSEPRG